jgi:hypothetical protein
MLRYRSIASPKLAFVFTCSCSLGFYGHVFTDTSTLNARLWIFLSSLQEAFFSTPASQPWL